MKTSLKLKLNRIVGSLALVVLGLARSASAADLTALELVKLGNDHVGKDSRNQIVQIRSEKSVATLTPVVWYVVYYDEDATFKASEVKFEAGKKVKVSRPARILEPITGDNKVLDATKIKIDSDKAITTATAEPLLKNLTLRATQVWLQRGGDKGPVWKVRIWAAKLSNPMKNVDVGEVYISAEDGKVTRSDLHINSVD
jgi:hypothetical protein